MILIGVIGSWAVLFWLLLWLENWMDERRVVKPKEENPDDGLIDLFLSDLSDDVHPDDDWPKVRNRN